MKSEENNANIESVPILCNIVGVKPYERFHVSIDILKYELYIDGLGYMRYADNRDEVGGGLLMQIINNPEYIKERIDFTFEEKLIASAFKSCFENGERVFFSRNEHGYLSWSVKNNLSNSFILPKKLFPSIEEGERYTAEMILGEDLK